MGRSTAMISASVARLVELGMGSLIMTRLKLMGLIITAVGVLVAGTATGVARQGSGTQEKPKPAEAVEEIKDVATPKPVAVEVAKEAVLAKSAEGMKGEARDQLEMARLRLEIRRAEVDEFKNTVIRDMSQIEYEELRLMNIRAAKNLDELRKQVGYTRADIDLEAAKKESEKWVGESVNNRKEALKGTVAKYSEMKRVLAREEQRIRDLEALAEPAGPSPGSAEAAGGDNPIDDDRLARIEAARLDIELLQMEVEMLKQAVTRAAQTCVSAKDRMRSLMSAHPGTDSMQSGFQPLKGQALEDAKKEGQAYLDHTQTNLEETRAAYLSKNRDLKREQSRLKDLETQPGAPKIRAALAEPSTESKKPADLEARLSDVEKKLDLILKALKK